MSEHTTMPKWMTVILIIALALLAIVVTAASALAFNETDTAELRNITDNQTQLILAYLQNVNSTLHAKNFTFSQLDINNLAAGLATSIENSVSRVCNPYVNPNATLADPLQKAFEGALNNKMDEKFIDQRQWIEQTYIKKNDEFQQLQAQKDTCVYEQQVLQNTYETARITSNVTIQACRLETEKADEQTQFMTWLAIAEAAMLVLILMYHDFFKNLFKR